MKKLIILLIVSTLIPSDFINNGITITIQEDVTVNMDGDLENNGTINNSGTLTVSGDFTNTGECNFDPMSLFILNGEDQLFPSMTYGSLTIEGTGTKSMEGDCSANSFILNSGILSINGHTLSVESVISYNGGYVLGEGSILHQGVEVYGCMDVEAINYSSDYIFDSGDCVYGEPGCNDDSAYNYNEDALWNDGSCIYYGDVTQDGSIDVVDVIAMVGYVLGTIQPTPEQIILGDVFIDGMLNIYDIVSLIAMIFENEGLLDLIPLTNATLIQNKNSLTLSKTGSIAGLQIEYEGEFESSLEGWLIEKNENTILMVSLDGSDFSEISYTGDLKITSCSVVDWSLNKIQADVRVIPDQFSLKPAYPNPFNPITVTEYAIPHDAYVVIKIFDIRGQEVAVLVDDLIKEGHHEAVWDASQVSSGVYIIRMTSGSFKAVQKVVYVK
jgi:hypothetical protein